MKSGGLGEDAVARSGRTRPMTELHSFSHGGYLKGTLTTRERQQIHNEPSPGVGATGWGVMGW